MEESVISETNDYECKCPHCGNEMSFNLSNPEYNNKLHCFEQIDTCIECGGRWIERYRLFERKKLVEQDCNGSDGTVTTMDEKTKEIMGIASEFGKRFAEIFADMRKSGYSDKHINEILNAMAYVREVDDAASQTTPQDKSQVLRDVA